MHFRAAIEERRCTHRHRSEDAARWCRQLGRPPGAGHSVVRCIGDPSAPNELESRVAPVFQLVK